MTRARALKQIIRTRAARTGERYTTARRHVLAGLAARQTPSPTSAPAPEPPKPSPAPRATPKSGLSDAKAREHTGHGFDHWFELLDRFGAVEKGHTAAARHLVETHGVRGWYAQGITVAYERARGVRAMNQRVDGGYEVSVSKVLTATTDTIVAALTNPRTRKRWSGGIPADLVQALFRSLDAPGSKGIVVRPDGQGRYRYRWGTSIVQIYLLPKPGGKVSFVASNMKLADPSLVDERRTQWRAALAALAASLR